MLKLSIPLAGICIIMLAGAVPAQEDPNTEDLKKLQGAWEVASLETEGKKEFSGGGAAIVIKGKTMLASLILWGTPSSSESQFTIDATKKPKEIDTVFKDKRTTLTTRGLYRFDGDQLVVCTSSTEVRPPTFDSKEGRTIMVLRRKK